MKKEMLRRLEALETERFGSPQIARYVCLKLSSREEEADRLRLRARLDVKYFSNEALHLLAEAELGPVEYRRIMEEWDAEDEKRSKMTLAERREETRAKYEEQRKASTAS
jgi:hypothetical protein